MSSEENKTLINRFIDEVKNKANAAFIDEVFAPDVIHHLPLPGLTPGRQGIQEAGAAIRAAFPDVYVDVEFLLADGDKVVERSRAHATHKGEFAGVPATGKEVGWTETHIYRLANGKIAEQWSELNLFGVLQQISGSPGQG